jgi:folate-dependent phosphoribosylglycinamide formyltransferase PurN
MPFAPSTPSVVLLCHDDEIVDREGLSRWLAASMRLAGVIVVRDRLERRLRALGRERRRSGWLGVADVLAFRALYRLTLSRGDRAWATAAVSRLTAAYPASIAAVPRLEVTDPNGADTVKFLRTLQPDIMVARCKRLLSPSVFEIPRAGTFVLHPGFCPEYRNAHGCFWALVNRDLTRVGVTMLRIDRGIDTGPVFFQARCTFNERRESHTVIQYRAVLDHLPAIRDALIEAAAGRARPISTAGRQSRAWGQPRLTAFWRWQKAARAAAETDTGSRFLTEP